MLRQSFLFSIEEHTALTSKRRKKRWRMSLQVKLIEFTMMSASCFFKFSAIGAHR